MSSVGTVFRLTKGAGLQADVFAAVGLAHLLGSSPAAEEIILKETESAFEVYVQPELSNALVKAIPQTPGYPFLKASVTTEVPEGAQDLVDYAVEKAKADRRKKLNQENRKRDHRRIDKDTERQIQEEQLRGDWRLLQVLNALQGDETSNRVHATIVGLTASEFHKELSDSLDRLVNQQPSELPWQASSVQLFSPLAAKGYSRLKPDSTDRNDKTKEQWTDPFREWLRYRGYFRVASPYFQGPKGEHVRLVCPVPRSISVRNLESLAIGLRSRPVYGGAPKIDSLAVLNLADLLVRHSEEYGDADAEVWPGLFLKGKSPAEIVSGVMVTHYQSMGNAKAVGAMSLVALPGWFNIETAEDARVWLEMLDEHQRVVRGLVDDHSDEIGLLIQYRRFLEVRGDSALWALADFMARYGALVMGVNGQRQDNRIRWVTRFTDEYFRRIVMGTDKRLAEIIADPGFDAVSRAVRQATVAAQNRRARYKAKLIAEDTWREIRYDLLHDIHRTRQVPGTAFVECIGEFIWGYNYENARRRETQGNPKAAPANLSDDEMKSFLALVDEYGPSVVGALLAAYASCKEKWEADDNKEHATPENEMPAQSA